MPTEFSHQELSLLLFVLEGGEAADHTHAESASCEESCPVIEDLEDLFGEGGLPHDKKLARHLSNHLREGLIECGIFELMAASGAGNGGAVTVEDRAKLQQASERLKDWRCEINLDSADRQLLKESISRMPRAAWLTMPRALWRLKKKLKPR